MTVNQGLALLGVFILAVILAAGFKLALSDIDMNSRPGETQTDFSQASVQNTTPRPLLSPIRSVLGWLCLLLGCLVSLDYITGRPTHFFGIDSDAVRTFWLAMGMFLTCFVLCYFDYKAFLQFKQGRNTTELHKGLTGAWHGLSILGLTAGCVPQILILLGSGLARIFP